MKNSLIYLKGDIFSSPAEVLVNPVNVFGVMGKGLAAEFKRKYPNMFKRYKQFCDDKKFSVGQLWLAHEDDYDILLFPTKKHWRGFSKIEYIRAGLEKFVKTYAQKEIKSVAFPKLGCGYGGLDWEEVRPLMEKYLSDLPIEIYIYLDNEQNLNADAEVALCKDFSAKGVLAALKNHLKKCSTVEFREKTYTVALEDKNLCFDDGAEKLFADETFLTETLDKINRQNVFPVDESDLKFNLTAALLQKIGCLSAVLIQDDGEFRAGYQFKRGFFRATKKNRQPSLFD